LAWKLSLVLRGQAKPELLHSYEAERRPNVEKLINYDKDISRLMTMQLPLDWEGDPDADPNEVLGVVMAEAATFSSGLGIFYEPDTLLNIQGSFKSSSELTAAGPGKRVPDVQLLKPGTFEVTRLHKQTPNIGKFYVVIFTGNPASTRQSLKHLSDILQRSPLCSEKSLPISWLTICAMLAPSACEVLGIQPFGKIFYDKESVAHRRFSVDSKEGAIFVLRPDGWIGTAVCLNDQSMGELEEYFKRILVF